MVLGQMVHGAVDLTAEKRHTLADGTRQLLQDLQDDVLVTCYLTGELPQEWRRLEREMESLLQRMSRASDGKLTYQFVDIYAVDDPQTVGQNEQALYERGLQFTRIAFEENGMQSFKTVWPGAMVAYRGEESPIQFFGSEVPQADEAMIQGSINTMEYQLAAGIRKARRLSPRASPSSKVMVNWKIWPSRIWCPRLKRTTLSHVWSWMEGSTCCQRSWKG